MSNEVKADVAPTVQAWSRGLAGVIAAETVLSEVDGAGGRLIVRGHAIEDLAGHQGYEAVAALLLDGFAQEMPIGEFHAAVAEGRRLAYERFADRLIGGTAGLDPVEAMRWLLAEISDRDGLARPATLIGATGMAAAIAIRAAQGKPTSAPDPYLPHARDLLRLIRGAMPPDAEVQAFETYLATVIDHGLNASTFTARVVASTEAGLPSAVIAALSALKGRLHGGAPGPVLDMLDAIGSEDRAEAWIEARIDEGGRIMGFGHRAYRVRDPRADILRAAMDGLGESEGRVVLARGVERAALAVLARRKSGRRLDVNVEFHTALLLERLAVPRSGFTAVFAAARSAGWIAHALEQQRGGGLIRPDALYVGPRPAEGQEGQAAATDHPQFNGTRGLRRAPEAAM